MRADLRVMCSDVDRTLPSPNKPWKIQKIDRVFAELSANVVTRRHIMLHYAAVFFIIALIAGIFGFGFVASAAAGIAKILFWVFVVLFLVSLVYGGFGGRGGPPL